MTIQEDFESPSYLLRQTWPAAFGKQCALASGVMGRLLSK